MSGTAILPQGMSAGEYVSQGICEPVFVLVGRNWDAYYAVTGILSFILIVFLPFILMFGGKMIFDILRTRKVVSVEEESEPGR